MAGLARNCAAQDDGPLLPGLESSVSQEPTPAIEPDSESTIEPPAVVDTVDTLPADDGIAPLDADGIPQSGPSDEPQSVPQLVLPDPPSLQPEPSDGQPQEAPRKKNLWQKSTDKIRTLTKPEPKAGVPAKEKPVTPNWQLLRRTPPEASQPEASKSGQSERARQQQLQLQQQQQLQRLQQQRLQQQRLEQQRQQQQRLQMQRLEQQRTLQEAPQSRWQSQEAPQQSSRAQAAPRTGSGQTSSRRQVQGNQTPQYQSPQDQVPRPQQGQKQQRTSAPRSAASTPHAPWDMQPTATIKSGVAARPVPLRSSGAASQTTRAPRGRTVPR
jgi:hypothetical protein